MHGFDAGDDDSGAAKVLESAHKPHDPFDGAAVSFDDNIEVLGLAQRDVKTGIGLDAADGHLVGSAHFDGDFLWHIVQFDRPLEKRASPAMHFILLVRLAGIEPATLGFGGQYSIH